MHAAQLVDAFTSRPHIEIIKPALPNAIVDDIQGAFIRTIGIPHVSQKTRDVGAPARGRTE